MRKSAIALLLMVGASPAYAETYCRTSQHTTFGAGGTVDIDWTVTASSGRRIQTMMQSKPTTGCSWSIRTLGGQHRPVEIVQAPHLGSLRFPYRYRLFYRADTPGEDQFAVRIHWLDRSGKPSQAVARFRVHVRPTGI